MNTQSIRYTIIQRPDYWIVLDRVSETIVKTLDTQDEVDFFCCTNGIIQN